MEADPDFLGPAALAKAMRFVGDVRETHAARAAQGPERRARHLGLHALLLLPRSAARRASTRATRSRSWAPRPSATASRATRARSTPRSSSPRRTAAAGSRRPSSCRARSARSPPPMDMPFAMRLARAGKVPNPLKAHKAEQNDEVKRLWKLLEADDEVAPRRHADRSHDRHLGALTAMQDATRTTRAAWPRSRPRSSTRRRARCARASTSSCSSCRLRRAAAPATSTRPSPTTTCISTRASSARPS